MEKLRALNDKLLAEFAESERGVQRASADDDSKALAKLASKRDALRERLAATRQRLTAAEATHAADSAAYFDDALPAALRAVERSELDRVKSVQSALQSYVELEQTVAVTTTRSVLPELESEIAQLDGPTYVATVAELISNTADPDAPQPPRADADADSPPLSPADSDASVPAVEVTATSSTAVAATTDAGDDLQSKYHAAVQKSKEYLKISTWRDKGRLFKLKRSKAEAVEAPAAKAGETASSDRVADENTAAAPPRTRASSDSTAETADSSAATLAVPTSPESERTDSADATSAVNATKSAPLESVVPPTDTRNTADLARSNPPTPTKKGSQTSAADGKTTKTGSRKSWKGKMRAAMEKVKVPETVAEETDDTVPDEDLEDIPL